jgi:F420-non-reducing hydrogenase iron-sulfur subunit
MDMNEAAIYLCKNCFSESGALPSQWNYAGVHVRVKLIPCSGKIDAQYIMHAFEGGIHGVCVITCPEGKCKLSQGNYRAHMRIATVRRLLSEAGIDPENARIVQCDGSESADRIIATINETVGHFTGSAIAAR